MSLPEKKAFDLVAEQQHYFLPLLRVAEILEIEPTTVRRWIWKREVIARKRDDARGYEVNVTTLPPKYRAMFMARAASATVEETETASPLREVAAAEQVERYAVARETVRERAELRLEAVLSFRKARASRAQGETFAAVEERWLRNFRRTHDGMNVSIRSVKDWSAAYDIDGFDALVDGNDGVKRKGARIPAVAKQMFRDEFLRSQSPNLRLCYDNVVDQARLCGWGPMPSYDTFWRYAKSIPKMVRKLRRECADKRRTVLPHVVRDPNSIPAYHTIQSDHREIDVPVRCDKGCPVCAGKKPKGHFPIWTAFIDIRSRRILGSDISIDAPDSSRILSIFRRITDENGLTRELYLDNGADYRKAFGKRLRKQRKAEWDGPSEEHMQARFASIGIEVIYAIPYNAQAKLIERMFRTFRHRFDEDFEAYRGTLGRKSEIARELFYRPSELPTISELAFLLQLAIERYNATPHSGRGMEGRTPDEVFHATRIERREPDRAWALLFYEPIKGGRIVDRNGVRHEGYIYRLSSLEKHLEYFGERVDVRINPDDQRRAIILDATTGAYVCDAVAETDLATYSTNDAVTRALIARVFHDGRELMKMAAAHVEGAKERLAEYRRAKLVYLMGRAAELHAQQDAATGNAPVVMVPQLSGIARQIELTASVITSVLDADDAASGLCVVSRRKRGTEEKPRRDPRLSYAGIANQLGVSLTMLKRYRSGETAWPEGMAERFEAYEQMRAGAPVDAALLITEQTARRRKQVKGAASYANIAKTLGVAEYTLLRYRSGALAWPQGMKERFEELERQRGEALTAAPMANNVTLPSVVSPES